MNDEAIAKRLNELLGHILGSYVQRAEALERDGVIVSLTTAEAERFVAFLTEANEYRP